MRALPRKQAKAITALLNHRTVGEAAEAVGVAQSTLFRYMTDEKFQSYFRDAKRRVVNQAITHIQQISGQAVEALKNIMTDENMPASSRVTAARTVLDISVKAVELENLTSRIEAIESVLMRGENHEYKKSNKGA